ncbi:MAG: hypothetical protein JNL81_00710 [Hyphomonadaceae bacterium]|nr:hypothetical protein [Hyphomonadaceae bacterium]
MTLTQWSDLSQTIAALAVIASLVFLGIQVRQSTEQAKHANRLARAQVTAEVRASFNDLFRRAMEDREFARAIIELSDHAKPADETRMPQMATLCFNLMSVSRQAHELVRGGLIDEWAVRDVDQQLYHLISHPRFTPLFRTMVGMADPGSVTDADRAWVRHLNAGVKAYRTHKGDTPYSLAASPPPLTDDSVGARDPRI